MPMMHRALHGIAREFPVAAGDCGHAPRNEIPQRAAATTALSWRATASVMNRVRVERSESERRYSFVETTFGTAVLEWTDEGIARVELPDGNPPAPRAAASIAARPTGFAADAARKLQSYFAGEEVDFDSLPLDLSNVPGFARQVYAAARQLKRGELATYGELAERMGMPGSARAVGGALGRNPVPLIVPCHRVVAAGGRVGGFSAGGGITLKRRMLALENASALKLK
jgi:methylated-DNA-[protein]-cysteine S-methyltransferase